MREIKKWTKEAESINAIFNDKKWSNKGSIYDAYGKPSAKKVSIWKAIEKRAKETAGYNDDLRVVSRNGYLFSTMYSFTVDGTTYIVYDTKSDTKMTELV